MVDPWSDDELRRVATLYHLGDETMESIAQRQQVSRSTVSRQLKLARERGIVRISVDTGRTDQGLGGRIAQRFGVTAHVVPVRDTTGDSRLLQQVCRYAGRLLSDWFADDMILGVAWGTTMSALMDHLVPKPTHGSTIVQLNGAVHASSTEIRSMSDLLGRACDAFDARPQFFPVPAFFDDPATRAALWRERSIAAVVELQQRCDIAVFGVGSWIGEVSQVYAGGYLDPADLEALRDAGAVGDICTTFLRLDGSWADLSINARGSGPDLTTLARLPRRVCVVAGQGRVPGTIGALHAGVITDLVIDEHTAEALLAFDPRQVSPR